MMRLSFVLSTVFLLSSCLHQQDQLGSRIDTQSDQIKTVDQRMAVMEKTIERFEKNFKELEQSVRVERADTQVLVQDLRVEIQRLRGDMEEVSHSQNKLEGEMVGLRRRTSEKNINRGEASGNDIAVYDETLKLILDEKDYDLAIDRFNSFLKKFPNSSLAPNAAYWIGEGHFAKKEYDQSIIAFQKVVEGYPKSEKVCASILKQGMAFESLEQKDKAKLFYEETQSRCKAKEESSIAKAKIKKLK